MADRALYSVGNVTSLANDNTLIVNVGNDIKQIKKSDLMSDLNILAYGESGGGKNLFNIEKVSLGIDALVNNGGFENTKTDTRTYFNPYILAIDNNSVVKTIASAVVSTVGRVTLYGTVPDNTTKLHLKHNGSKIDISLFNYELANTSIKSGDRIAISFDCVSANPTVVGGISIKNVQIEKGTQATDYVPYIKSVKQLTDAQNDDLKMLGWTVPSEMPIQNYTSDGVFHQRVGRVDISNTIIENVANDGRFKLTISNVKFDGELVVGNIICSKYTTSTFSKLYYKTVDKAISTHSAGAYVYDSSYTTVEAFKNANKGVYIYYELATEIVTSVDGNEKVNTLANQNNDLKMLGWTVPSEMPIQNYTANGVFHQRVGRVDLSKLSWGKDGSDSKAFFNYDGLGNKIGGKQVNTVGYITVESMTSNTSDDYAICLYDNRIRIRDTRYTTVESFKNAMQGQYLYYELAQEVTMSVDGNEAIEQIDTSLDDLSYGESAGGKNLCPINSYSSTSDADVLKKEPISLKANTNYTISFNTSVTRAFELILRNGNNIVFDQAFTVNVGKGVYTFKPSSNIDSVQLYVTGATNVTDLMLEEGAVATPYEPYIPSVKMLAEETEQIKNGLSNVKAPSTKAIAPYGEYRPISGGTVATGIKFAIAANRLYIKTYDSNGNVNGTFYVILTTD